MSIFVVDTHALVWYLSRDSRLSKRAEELLDMPDGVIVATALIYRDSIDSSTKLITKDKSIIESHTIDTVW